MSLGPSSLTLRTLSMLVAFELLLSGCLAQDAAHQKKLADLEASVTALEGQLKTANEQLDSIQNDIWDLKNQVTPYKMGYFDPASPAAYQRIDTDGGTFLVSIQNVAPYLDGFRVTANFGNPSSATFHGFKLKATWGARLPRPKGMTFEQWNAATREKEFALTDVLLPGTWNRVSFVISPAKAEEFGRLALSMDTNSISLR